MSDFGEKLKLAGIEPDEFTKLAQEELDRRRWKEFVLSDPFKFHTEFLCQPDKVSYLRPFHREGLEFVNKPGSLKKKIILWPRGHLKSTIFTQGETLRRVLINPNLRVLINSSTCEMSKGFLQAIKGYLQDPRIVNSFGDLLPNTRSGAYYKNNESELTVLSRSNKTLKEPTWAVSGLDKTKTSQHYDLMVHDDLVVRENVGTFEMMDKVHTIWRDSLDLLEPGGEMWIIGTRWHPLDLYGRLIMDHCEADCADGEGLHKPHCSCQFDVSIKTIRDPQGSYILDSKFDDRIAQELLQQKGRMEFAAQYLNDPADPGTVWFPPDKVRAAEISPQDINSVRKKLTWYMAVDPAESLEKRSSFTAVVAVGVDHETGIWYVDLARQARVETPQFVELVLNSHSLIQPHRFGMEHNTRKALLWALKDRMVATKHYFNIEELKPALGHTPHAKEVRIKRLIPLFEFGRIRVNKTLNDLLNQLATIPAATSWDLVDALSYIADMVPQGLGAGTPAADRLPTKVTTGGITYAVRRIRGRNSNPRNIRRGARLGVPLIPAFIRARQSSRRAAAQAAAR